MLTKRSIGNWGWLIALPVLAIVACARGPAGIKGPPGLRGAPGTTGAAGPSYEHWYRLTIAAPGASSAAPNTVDAGTYGPFNLSGHCYLNTASPQRAVAELYLSSSDGNARLTDYGAGHQSLLFSSRTGAIRVGYTAAAQADGGAGSDLEGPYDGYTSAMSSDLKTYIVGMETTGVFVGGPTGPTCSFDGWVISPP